MMIHTLTSSLALYHINRNRARYLTKIERERAIRLAAALAVCIALLLIIWL